MNHYYFLESRYFLFTVPRPRTFRLLASFLAAATTTTTTMPLFLERKKVSSQKNRSRSLVDIMHDQRRSSKKKALAQQQQQQQQQQDQQPISSRSTDSTVSSCRDSVCSTTSGNRYNNMERDDQVVTKCVRFGTVSIRVLVGANDKDDNTINTTESVDRYEIRKTALALEREIGALKLEEYQRMVAASSRSRKKTEKEHANSKEAVRVPPRRIRVVTRSPQQQSSPSSPNSPSHRRRRILVKASSLSQLSLLPLEDLPVSRRKGIVVSEKENVQNNNNKPPVVDTRSAFRFLRSDSFSGPSMQDKPVDPRRSGKHDKTASSSPVSTRLRFRRSESCSGLFVQPDSSSSSKSPATDKHRSSGQQDDSSISPVDPKRSAFRFLRSDSFSGPVNDNKTIESKRNGSFSVPPDDNKAPVDNKRSAFPFLRSNSVSRTLGRSMRSPRTKRDSP